MIRENEFEEYTYRCDKQLFQIGEKVFTCMSGCLGGEILDVREKTFYLVKYRCKRHIPYSNRMRISEDTGWFAEWQLSKMSTEGDNFTRKKNWKDDIQKFSNKKTIRAWFDMLVEQGLEGRSTLDLNPSYQRDLVWTLEDKCALLDSIFNLKHTGNLIIIENEHYQYEVLDGKQRLSTVFDYIKNKFPYKGKYFHDLSLRDKNAIKTHFFHYTQITGDFTEEQKVELFIDFNTTGTQVDPNFIKQLKNKYFK